MRMTQIARDYSIGLLFAASVATVAIGLTQFFQFHRFVGLNQTGAIVMMSLGSAAAIATTILSIYFCGKVNKAICTNKRPASL